MVVDFDLLLVTLELMRTASARQLCPARDEFDAFAARTDLSVSQTVQASHNGDRPVPQVPEGIEAVVQIDARVWLRDFKRQSCMEFRRVNCSLIVRPCFGIV